MLCYNILSVNPPLPVRPQGPQDWAIQSWFFIMGERTYVYIDGLNFYYGLVKNTPYRWLDFKSLFVRLLPRNLEILKIKYFTARVRAFPQDPQAPHRQRVYLRALEVFIPEIEIHYGTFLVNERKRKLTQPLFDASGKVLEYATVIEPEEKGSDVNLAVHLLNDAWLDCYDWAVVVSNDSDLAEALRLVKEQGKKILLVPTISSTGKVQMKKPTAKLSQYADAIRYIHPSALRKSQLPEVIPGTNLHRPPEW